MQVADPQRLQRHRIQWCFLHGTDGWIPARNRIVDFGVVLPDWLGNTARLEFSLILEVGDQEFLSEVVNLRRQVVNLDFRAPQRGHLLPDSSGAVKGSHGADGTAATVRVKETEARTDQLILVSRMDKLTAKAPRMVPWHSLVSASRACEEDLEPDAVPEAVPEVDFNLFHDLLWHRRRLSQLGSGIWAVLVLPVLALMVFCFGGISTAYKR